MRKLVATLACRNPGSRLYGKPLQNLDIENHVTILDHIVSLLSPFPSIDEVVLGIAEGHVNYPFVKLAQENGIEFILGSEEDVLMRLIQCVEHVNGTDAFRITTESPFTYFEMIEEARQVHIAHGNDVTAIDGLPEGCHFEIYTLDSLKKSHKFGDRRHRSEFCSLYIREHEEDFQIEILPVPKEVERLEDIRLTVDCPEDLVVCREVYMNLKEYAPRIPLTKIIEFLDTRPELKELVRPFIIPEKLW